MTDDLYLGDFIVMENEADECYFVVASARAPSVTYEIPKAWTPSPRVACSIAFRLQQYRDCGVIMGMEKGRENFKEELRAFIAPAHPKAGGGEA